MTGSAPLPAHANAFHAIVPEAERARFLAEHYLSTPFSLPHAAAGVLAGVDEALVQALVVDSACETTVVGDGRIIRGPRPSRAHEIGMHRAAGRSLVFRHGEGHHPLLRRFADDFREALGGRPDVHVYSTPARHFSFGWHYDAEEVFILQATGAKTFYLRENTLLPSPVADAMPRDLQLERETSGFLTCALEAGDWLYIPAGWWHVATAVRDSLSVSVGLLAPSPLDFIEDLRRRLTCDPSWRRRLPPSGSARDWLPADAQGRDQGRITGLFAALAAQSGDAAIVERFARSFAAPGT
jgi:ribosomal protein L16 Arg81 hydroxylase